MNPKLQLAIRSGLACPLCKQGKIEYKELKQSQHGLLALTAPRLICSNCGKQLMIRYKVEPFEILEIIKYDG